MHNHFLTSELLLFLSNLADDEPEQNFIINQSEALWYQSKHFLQCSLFFFLSTFLHISSLDYIRSLDINQVELDLHRAGSQFQHRVTFCKGGPE